MAEPRRDRPRMPVGYGIAADAGPEMVSWASVEQQLAAVRNYWLATTRPDGRPHAMPVWGLWFEGAFCFGTDPASQKGRNIATQPYVVVHLESGDDVVVLEGVAERVTDSETLRRFVEAYDAKYGFRPEPDKPEQGVYMVRPNTAFAWRERDFPTSATRWRF